jgi:hypothetical protein
MNRGSRVSKGELGEQFFILAGEYDIQSLYGKLLTLLTLAC